MFIPAGETAYLRVGETINYRLHYRGNRSKLSSYCGIGIGFFVASLSCAKACVVGHCQHGEPAVSTVWILTRNE